jgi:general secretion pathway protein D
MVFIRPTILRDANVYSGVSSNKYTLFRAEQLSRAAEEGYATSPARQVLPAYGQDVMMSPEVQQQIQRMQAQQQATATGVRAQVQEQPFVQSKP